jgi:hypothetical protein
MIFVGALGVVTGLVVASYFGVFILLPATLLAITGMTLIGVVTQHSLVQAGAGALYLAVGLQLGFITGALLKTYLTSTAADSPRAKYRKVAAMSAHTEASSGLETSAESLETGPALLGDQCETQRR